MDTDKEQRMTFIETNNSEKDIQKVTDRHKKTQTGTDAEMEKDKGRGKWARPNSDRHKSTNRKIQTDVDTGRTMTGTHIQTEVHTESYTCKHKHTDTHTKTDAKTKT